MLPLALRVTMPAMTNNLVNLVKTTTLAYAIAVPELLYMSAQVWSEQVNVPEMMVVLSGLLRRHRRHHQPVHAVARKRGCACRGSANERAGQRSSPMVLARMRAGSSPRLA